MLNNTVIFLGAILVVVGMTYGAAVDFEQLTAEQRESLTDLRNRLNSELANNYQMEDFELVQWLKDSHFNVHSALKNVNLYLQLRKEQNVNQILNEDWSDLRALFPYSTNTVDKSGKPVLYFSFGDWNIARYLTSQEATDRLVRYVLMINEEADAHVRKLRADGQNVAQYSDLINVAGFSIEKHVCLQCSYFFRDVSSKLTPLTRSKVEKTNLVNVPFVFKMVYTFFSDDAQQFIQLYDEDQTELEKMLDSYIDKSQLPKGLLA